MPDALIPLAVKIEMARFKAKTAVRREAERALSGDVSIEYTLIAAAVSIALIGVLGALGKALFENLDKIVTELEADHTNTHTLAGL